MAELRWHPLTKDWVMIASNRQERPQMPKDWCPFCPGSGRVPDDYEGYCYDNDFPALSQNPPAPDAVGTEFFHTAPAYGKCEVILYLARHTAALPELSDEHVGKLLICVVSVFEALSADPKNQICFHFRKPGRRRRRNHAAPARPDLRLSVLFRKKSA
jgi:UDPglucose--hexose-1-phosphate uridylyltransferase